MAYSVKEILEDNIKFDYAVEELLRQISAIESKISYPNDDADMILKQIINEKQKALKYLQSEKRWNFNFAGGGWNSVQAITMDEAIAKAAFQYKDSVHCIPDNSTFRVATEADDKALLSLFY